MSSPKMKTQRILLQTALGNSQSRAPVWIMRQAGRYLESYRNLRKKYDFQTLYKNPELACQVTLLPIHEICVDGAILFSDILVIPEAMGMELCFLEAMGPVFTQPLKKEQDILNLPTEGVAEKLEYVYQTLRLVSRELKEDITLIGFSGAPWTLATYMVEGQGSKNFKKIKTLSYEHPEALKKLLEKLTQVISQYLIQQKEAGAHIVQLFDSWAGCLDEEGFLQFALPYVREILKSAKKANLPVIYFAKGAGGWLQHLKTLEADVIALDWTISPRRARETLGFSQVLQGNLDPVALYAPISVIEGKVKSLVKQFGKNWIANLGHGILPTTPPEHAKVFVEAVKRESEKHFAQL
ncbi:MAG: uroporphyrinogen decarboxylase [Planctomycetota bacterium]|nr:MAG: uroporphyrinogen decarboxylase [Planctomycetota bacterium]